MTYASLITTKYKDWKGADRLVQGDIYQDLNFVMGIKTPFKLDIEEITLRYAVILTQDCDLSSHQRALNNGKKEDRALLPSVLVCPAYPFEQFFNGEHLEGKKLGILQSEKKSRIKENEKVKRYHYIEPDEDSGLTELVIDFKHFYTVGYEVLKNARNELYITTINELYRENLSQRFAQFLSRIGLPDETI
jgi:hypothetical protein